MNAYITFYNQFNGRIRLISKDNMISISCDEESFLCELLLPYHIIIANYRREKFSAIDKRWVELE